MGELDQWASGSFEAKLVDDKIVSRGAINSKGALVAELMAIKALRETIGVPANIVFTFDGARSQGRHKGPRLQRTPHLPDERGHEPEHVLHGRAAQDGFRLLGERCDATTLRARP